MIIDLASLTTNHHVYFDLAIVSKLSDISAAVHCHFVRTSFRQDLRLPPFAQHASKTMPALGLHQHQQLPWPIRPSQL